MVGGHAARTCPSGFKTVRVGLTLGPERVGLTLGPENGYIGFIIGDTNQLDSVCTR